METYIHNIGSFEIHYNQYSHGGGIFYNEFNLKLLKNFKAENCLEICSGPGFIGYHLLVNQVVENLFLADFNSELQEHINITNTVNKVDVPFYVSDAFDSIPELKFDLIISNPPHLQNHTQYKELQDKGFVDVNENYTYQRYQKNILLDEHLRFHKKFFYKLDSYLNLDGKVVLYENGHFITPSELIELGNVNYDYEVNRSIFKNSGMEADFYALTITKFK